MNIEDRVFNEALIFVAQTKPYELGKDIYEVTETLRKHNIKYWTWCADLEVELEGKFNDLIYEDSQVIISGEMYDPALVLEKVDPYKYGELLEFFIEDTAMQKTYAMVGVSNWDERYIYVRKDDIPKIKELFEGGE